MRRSDKRKTLKECVYESILSEILGSNINQTIKAYSDSSLPLFKTTPNPYQLKVMRFYGENYKVHIWNRTLPF